ncbi:MAG: sigma-70 family RNA polymerase sigma factor [Thermoanaerobaculia bacterium]|nr:MAG: sigma-70 family RNA polymerase sigma factor [Thermoanaerobaculia bacterium]MBZ0103929.1 sigma-70 family RNA polymerase sigma factor [Thermoanaerobaculia bacterium]
MPHEPLSPPDEELVRAVLAGDPERFGDIVERYQSRLVNYLNRLVRDPEEAQDLAQEVFVRVYQALDRFDPQYRFSTWLFRVAQNAAIDVIRKRRFRLVPLTRQDEDGEGTHELELADGGPSAQDRMEGAQSDARVREAIDRLPDEYRELIRLRHYGELAYDEIAESRGMPLGTVKNKLFRARQMLRGLLEAED